MSDKPAFDPSQPFDVATTNPSRIVSSQGPKPAFDPSQPFETGEDHFGTIPQQLLTVGEGIAKGVAGPLAPALEEATGLTTGEDIRGREEANPVEHGLSEAGGFIGSLGVPILKGAGLAAQVANIGEHAASLTGLGLEGAGTLSKLANAGVKTGAELAAIQASDELSKVVEGDPNQSIGSAAINIGLSGVLGFGGGAAIGAVSPLWKATVGESTAKMIDGVKSQASADGLDQKTLLESLQDLKPHAQEIKNAADLIGAPLLESQISASKHIQDLDSILINSPSPVGVARQQLLQSGIDKANAVITDSLGSANELSQADVGNAIKSSLTSKIEAEAAPINSLYETLKQSTDNIPVSNYAKGQITRNIRELENFKFSGSPTEKFGNHTIENLSNINTVDDIKRYKTLLNSSLSPTASPAERFAVGQLSEKLSNLEENSIIRAAQDLAEQTNQPELKQQVLGLIDQRKEANSAYMVLREKMSDLGEVLGKKRIRGTQDFLNFVDDLSPEKLTSKLFSKGNSEALSSFVTNFPEESGALFKYQKSALRNSATVDGVVNPSKILKELDKLSPEVRKLMFTEQELKRLNAAKVYVDSIPKSANPSGTSKAEAYRRFFTNPISASLQTGSDYGIGKIIGGVVPKGTLEKTVSAGSHNDFFNHIFPTMEKHLVTKETNPSAFKGAVDYGLSVLKGQKVMNNAVNNFFKPGAEIIGKNLIPDQESREKLDKALAQFDNPDNAMKVGGEIGHYLPDHGTAAAQTGATAANYLNSLKPKHPSMGPLDKESPPDRNQLAKYNRALDIAQQPLLALHYAKKGMLLPQDVETLNTIYPNLHNSIANKLQTNLIDHASKGKALPYAQRQSLSLLVGTPLDGTMTQPSMQAIIMSAAPAAQANQAQQPGRKRGASGAALGQIQKVTNLYQTSLESRAADRRN